LIVFSGQLTGEIIILTD